MGKGVNSDYPPSIEHVTQNYVSLRNVLLSITAWGGKELANVLRTTGNLPSDAARKEQFLKYVIACRQEYVKLYVVCKWAVVSGDISQAIDVANWLHGQINCFNNVVGALYHLQSDLGPAKSPWADIETALQVYKYGSPSATQEAKLFLPKTPLSNAEVLKVLRRLDILIAVRLALHEQIPPYYRTYSVSNGRARFMLGADTFWVEFSIADDDVAAENRFFFVDCEFSSSAGPETSKASFKQRIEAIVNEQLSQTSLVSVLDWLSLFCAIHKLQLLHKQLLAIEREAGPWASVVSHKYVPATSTLTLRYFVGSTHQGETLVSISPRAPHTLTVEPFIDVDLNSPVDALVPSLLSQATKEHAAQILKSINVPWITPASDFTLLIELTPSKNAELSIDSTSGQFALSGGGPLTNAAHARLKSGDDPIEVLSDLRTQVYMGTIARRAEAVGWCAQRNIRLAPGEHSEKLDTPNSSILALRLPGGNGWSLCVAFGADKPWWFATRLQCFQRRWSLGPVHEMHSSLNLENPDYGVFVELMKTCSKQFVLYELTRELSAAKIKHAFKQQGGQKVAVVVDIETIIPDSSTWAHTGLMCTVDDDIVTMEGRARVGHIAALGSIDEDDSDSSHISIHGQSGVFIVKSKHRDPQLHFLIEALKRIHQAAKSLESAMSLGLEVLSATLSSLEIKYANPDGVLSVHDGHNITFAKSNPQTPLAPFLPDTKDHRKDSLGVVVTFLREFYRVWDIVTRFTLSHKKPLVILPQTANQFRVQAAYELASPFLEVSHRYSQREHAVIFVTAGNGAEKLGPISDLFAHRKTPGVVPLVTGCAVEIGSEDVFVDMINALRGEI